MSLLLTGWQPAALSLSAVSQAQSYRRCLLPLRLFLFLLLVLLARLRILLVRARTRAAARLELQAVHRFNILGFLQRVHQSRPSGCSYSPAKQ